MTIFQVQVGSNLARTHILGYNGLSFSYYASLSHSNGRGTGANRNTTAAAAITLWLKVALPALNNSGIAGSAKTMTHAREAL